MKYLAEQFVDTTLEVQLLVEVHVLDFGTQSLQECVIEIHGRGSFNIADRCLKEEKYNINNEMF